MENSEIYRRAIKQLFQKTNGKFEHDEEKPIQLFDKLIDKGITIHCDEIQRMCLEEGYDDFASDEISHIYDYIDFYKKYRRGEIVDCWREDLIDEIIKG